MLTTDSLRGVLRALSSALMVPDLIILILLIAVTLVMAGMLVTEIFTEQRHLKANLPELLNALQKKNQPLEDILHGSGLLKRQKMILLTVCDQKELTPLKRESLAGELLSEERARYDLRVKITDLVMRLGPMFGLLGTLIPLGPGIIAMGRGDTYTLSTSLLTAFDTTVAGLIAAAAATVLSTVRRRWYARDLELLDSVMECLLEAMDENEKT